MATKRKVVQKRITTHQEAYLKAVAIQSDVNGLRCVGEFLNSSHYGSTCMSIPDETKDWLRAILFDWIGETADRVEVETDRVAAFLREPAPLVPAGPGDSGGPLHVVREGGS